MKKLILPVLAALLPFISLFAQSDRYEVSTVTNEFGIAYSVMFEAGQKPESIVYYHYSITPDAPESKWYKSRVFVNFAGDSSVSGRTTGQAGCVPSVKPASLDGGVPRPGERRRVEIVHKDGFVAVYLEIKDKMTLCRRVGIFEREFLRAVSFENGKGSVSDVKISVDGPLPRQRPLKQVFSLPAKPGDSIRFGVRTQTHPGQIVLVFPDGSARPAQYTCSTFDQKFTQKLKDKNKKDIVKNHVVEDSGLEVCASYWDRNRIYSIARIGGRYRGDQMTDILENIDAYGRRASRHAFLFEIRRGDSGMELWIDHNFVRLLPVTEKTKEIVMLASSEAKFKRLPDGVSPDDPMRLSLAVPKPFDTSACKINLGSYSLECDGYLSREPSDALPDSFLRRVPVATYARAVVRCRVDPAPTNTCELTARITNFHCPHNEGRSPDMITWQTKTLERKSGEQTVVFDFNPGKIQDLIHDMGYEFLDFELLGGMDGDPLRGSPLTYSPSKKPSGVTVLGVSLVKAPASLRISNGEYGNVFVDGEKPFVSAEVRAMRAGEYALKLTVRDIDENIVQKSTERISLANGGAWNKKLLFDVHDVGWYSFDAELSSKTDGTIVHFPGAYTVIAKDTRKAGYESPYFTWSKLGNLDTNGFRRVAAFLKKVGVRRTQLKKYTEEDAKEFGLTLGECYAIRANGSTQEAKEADFERQAREAMKKWPHIDSALIFHEWYGSAVSAELWGGKTELTPEQKKTQERNVQEATWRAKIWRKVAPQVKLKVGNSGSSLSIMSDLFRGGYPKDLIDWIGEEGVGQMETPERSTGMAFRNLKDLAEIYGYTNGVAACYEWKSRRRCLFPNARKQAAWFVRDVLIALAWHSPQVTVETGPEIGNSYFNTSWGSGAFTHGPVMQPLPHISAIANLTRMMDRCRFVRLVPTGSQTVYLLEFLAPEGKYVYAAWTARGEIIARFRSEAKNLTVYDMYGREDRRFFVSKFKAKLSEEPTFFWMDAPIVAADGTGSRKYPWEIYPGLEKRKTLAKLDSLAGWSVDTNSMWRLEKCQWSGLPGSVAAADAAGAVEIRNTRAVPHHDSRCDYGFIRPDHPIPVPEGATTLALDVEGNSSWGKVLFEIEDALGRRWLSAGPNADYHDLSDTMALNYDGWHTLQFQIRWESPAKCYSLGSNMRQWYFVKGGGKREIVYPVKVSAIGFKLSRRGFDLLNWTRPQSDSIRIRNLSAY